MLHLITRLFQGDGLNIMSELVSNEEPTEYKKSKSPGGGDGNSLVDGWTTQAPTSQRDVSQALGGNHYLLSSCRQDLLRARENQVICCQI